MKNQVTIKIQVNEQFSIEASNPYVLRDVLLNLQCLAIGASMEFQRQNSKGHMSLMLDIAKDYERNFKDAWMALYSHSSEDENK